MTEREAGKLETALTETAEAPGIERSRIQPEDFESVVVENQKRIYRVLLALLHDEDEADCLTQECFLRAYRRLAGYRGEANISTWLTRIAINLAHDRMRSRRLTFWKRALRGEPARLESAGDTRRNPEQALLAQEKSRLVWAVVDRLPAKRRTAFVLRFAEDMSMEEIAAAMNLGLGTVKSHIFHAVRSVRRDLEKQL